MECNTENHGSPCLFCCQLTKNVPGFRGKSKLERKFFTFISRQMLGTICGSDISKSEKQRHKNNFKTLFNYLSNTSENVDEFLESVIFCKKCKSTIQQFCNVYNQIQQLKLQLDLNISKLLTVMRCTDRKNSSNNNNFYHEKVGNSLKGLSVHKIRTRIRKSLRMYQNIQKKSSFPRVRLTPIVIKMETDEEHVPSLFDPIYLEDTDTQHEVMGYACSTNVELGPEYNEPDIKFEYNYSTSSECIAASSSPTALPIQNEELSEIEPFQPSTMLSPVSEIASSPSPIKIRSKLPKSNKLTSTNNVCPVCEKTFREDFHLNDHQSFEHPELFFERSNIIWSAQNDMFFKMFVDNFLVEETHRRCVKIKSPNSSDEDCMEFKCSICFNILPSLRLMKSHLVLRHGKLMAGKLEHLQQSGKARHEIEMELEHVWKNIPKFNVKKI